MRRSDRAKHMRRFFGDILKLDSDETAIKLWSRKPKRIVKEKEIYIVPVTGREEFDKEVQKIIDSMAHLVDELDEKIDKWFGC